MREVWLVSSANKAKAEAVLKTDDLVSRQSIAVRAASSLEIKEEGYFIIIDGTEEALQRADELLKEIAEKYKDKEKVLERYDELESAAISGFGFIIGG
jgi:6-phosphogluconate dehydrogenase (decarboxylating)